MTKRALASPDGSRTVTSTYCRRTMRFTVNSIESSRTFDRLATTALNERHSSSTPFADTKVSPRRRPASSAGLPFRTPATSTRPRLGASSDCQSSSSSMPRPPSPRFNVTVTTWSTKVWFVLFSRRPLRAVVIHFAAVSSNDSAARRSSGRRRRWPSEPRLIGGGAKKKDDAHDPSRTTTQNDAILDVVVIILKASGASLTNPRP
mmetsp:Transcript_19557/g.62818  ORF Transcript_19557/g.62818 Transcript_19557/m.62818 type:complete len:205 (-) Transcript_19557:4-618(-)